MYRFTNKAGRRCVVNSEIKTIVEYDDNCVVKFECGDVRIKGTLEKVEMALGLSWRTGEPKEYGVYLTWSGGMNTSLWDIKWVTRGKVTHWMPLPEPPE